MNLSHTVSNMESMMITLEPTSTLEKLPMVPATWKDPTLSSFLTVAPSTSTTTLTITTVMWLMSSMRVPPTSLSITPPLPTTPPLPPPLLFTTPLFTTQPLSTTLFPPSMPQWCTMPPPFTMPHLFIMPHPLSPTTLPITPPLLVR